MTARDERDFPCRKESDIPPPQLNMYISLQTCHYLQLLEADVHVLEQDRCRELALMRYPSFPVDFGPQRAHRSGDRAITMERIRLT